MFSRRGAQIGFNLNLATRLNSAYHALFLTVLLRRALLFSVLHFGTVAFSVSILGEQYHSRELIADLRHDTVHK